MKSKLSAAPGFVFFVTALLGWSNSARAQQHAGGVSAAELAKANNPLADANAFNFQNYFLTSLYGVPDQTAWHSTGWRRLLRPLQQRVDF